MAWITNTVEDDPNILEEMFWPTPQEIRRNNRLNEGAKKWMKEFRKDQIEKRKNDKVYRRDSAINSVVSDVSDHSSFDYEQILDT